MRDKNRIKKLLKRLEKVWEENPDLRLPQLIGNVYHIPSGEDPYFVECEEFISEIEGFYKKE